ncbi:MAG: TIGR03545 family protein [Deltaproteobacteria bacterium]|jgi:uncharacterized protein (TIGR03545 family)|nr:TIGR03545 family protein [Deltaproteobacteria bacterium]
MKSMIRWPGLGLFAVVVLLLFLFFYFLVDGMIKRTIERQGSALVGAQVDLGAADLSFFPMGLRLSRLQITNPDAPLRNIVEIEQLAMSIAPLPLLERKIIIEEMTATGVRPDTARQSSGALPEYAAGEKDAAPAAKKGVKLPTLQIPDIKEVLAKEELTSVALAREYQAQVKADTAKWQQRLAELPNQNKMAEYRARLSKIKSSSGLAGLIGGATELVALKKEIEADMERLQTAQKEFSEAAASNKQGLAEVQSAPQQDIKRLKDKYSLSPEGLGHLSSLLFGAKTGGMVEQALAWHEKMQPLLQRRKEKKAGTEVVKPLRGEGVMVRFQEETPLPDFLIRHIDVSVLLEAGGFGGTIKNVTPDQDRLGEPLSFAFSGDDLQGLRAITLDGVLDHVNTAQPRDSVNLAINGYAVNNMVLSSTESLPVTIASGLADFMAQAVVEQRQVNAQVQAQLKAANFAITPVQPDNAISQALAGALADVSKAGVKARVTGTVDDYQVQLSSDLDSLLKEAAANAVKSQTARFEQQLQESIRAKTKGPVADAANSFGDFSALAEELKARLQASRQLL